MNNKYERKNKEILCSIITSICKITIVQPFDFLRFRLQTIISHQSSISLVSNIIKNEGITVFYKAASITTVMIFFNTTFHFYLFQEIVLFNKRAYRKKNKIPKRNQNCILKSCLNINSIVDHNKDKNFNQCNKNISFIYFKSGFFAGLISSFLFTPFDNMRIRLISEKNLLKGLNSKSNLYKNNNILDLSRKILKNEGIIGFYTGLNMSIIKESLGSALYFSTFEYIKNYLTYHKFSTNHLFILTFISGGLAGMCNWSFTYPFDIIKTKIISEKEFNNRLTLYSCVFNIYNSYGILGFYRNFSTIIIRSIIVNGFTLSIFDYSRKYFELE